MKPKLLVYLPVIHKGYLQFFSKFPKADIFIINDSLIEIIDQEFDYLRKEIHSITPSQAEISLEAFLPERNISLIGFNDLSLLDNPKQKIILPREDIFVWLAKTYLSKSEIIFDNTFLRWNRNNSDIKQKVENSNTIAEKKVSQQLAEILKLAKAQATLSSDWWRQVGAVIFDTNKIISFSHNKHLPNPYTPYINSDPRNSFHKGENIELSTAIHAEAALVADAAKKGIKLKGKSMYVSTFPCPVCAKQIACSGITKLYFSEGYAMLDGEKVLTDAGIKIIQIQ